MVEAAVFQGLSWNPVTDVQELFSYPFMVNALEAGTIVAVMAGVTGWFMVLRRQTFAGHTLSIIAFPGAAAAASPACRSSLGYFSFCALGALALAAIAGSRRSLSAESAAIGSLQALALALGFLFVSLYHGILNGLDSLLFGTFLGITERQVDVLLVVAAATVTLRRHRRRGRSSSPPSTPTSPAPPASPSASSASASCSCSDSPSPRRARSPARCSSSRSSSHPAATAHQLTARPASASHSRSRSRSPSPGSGSHSPTSRSIRSASTSPRSPSRSTSSPVRGRSRAHLTATPDARRSPGAGLMFAHEFMRNALIAGTFVGLACGLVGYFVVLRAQVFAGDALSHVAFTGALAAAVIGLDIRAGLFLATILGGLVLGLLGDRARADDVTIGSFFAWTLGLGVLFLSIFTTKSSAGNGTAGVRVLFGSIFGLSTTDVQIAVAISPSVACVLLLAIARPLLFATLDAPSPPHEAFRSDGLGLGFLALLGLVAAQASQAVGALLLLGLLAAPAGAAHRLTDQPVPRARPLGSSLASPRSGLGLTLSYVFPTLPPSSMIIASAVGDVPRRDGGGRGPRVAMRLLRRSAAGSQRRRMTTTARPIRTIAPTATPISTRSWLCWAATRGGFGTAS